jgi:TetR/AcrR family transcriptional regulator
VQRDPVRTRRRILAAAEREFSAKGLAGARVDAIARRAGVNKRMLYHYFGNKEALYRAVMLEQLTAEGSPFQAARLGLTGGTIEAHLLAYNAATLHDAEYIRLLEWEAIGAPSGRIAGEEERRRDYEQSIERVREMQQNGLLAAELDPAQLLLALIGLISFPVAFPQMARLITGRWPRDPQFQEQRVAFLRALARLLTPEPRPRPGRRHPE